MKKILIVCLGWGSIEESYRNMISCAPKDWEVRILDYSKINRQMTAEDFNNGFNKYLKQHAIDKFYLLGHSMGGALSLQYAYHFPKNIIHLYLVDTEGIYNQDNPIRTLFRVLSSTGTNIKKEGKLVLVALGRVFKKPVWHLKMGMFANQIDLQEEAKQLKVRTTLVWGDKDQVVPLWQGQLLTELIPNAQLIVIKDANHNWIMHDPEKFWSNVVK